MRTFNLIDEKWIPCVAEGGGFRELSLREALVECHHLDEIFDTSPLVTAALHRLLLAVLWGVFPIESLTNWKQIWQRGCFDHAPLNDYLKQWHKRFDLLDEVKPFYQRGGFTLKKKTPLKRLGVEFAVQNNATLFDHSWDEDRPPIPPSIAARWIVATQAFAPSAGKSETIHTKDSPWTRGAVILMQGDTLFETLALNLLNLRGHDFLTSPEDRPAWEDDEDWQPAHDQLPHGPLEYLTWQSRSIRLLLEDAGSIRECYLAQGRSLPEAFNKDPMHAYRRHEKFGLLTWQFSQNRVMWRDSHALFNLSQDAPFLVPQALHDLAGLVREKTLPHERLYRIQVLGQCLESGQPTIHFWRNEKLPLNPDYLNDKSLLDELRKAINLAEEVASNLRNSIYSLAKELLEFVSERNAETKDVKSVLEHFGVERFYWSRLETPFSGLLTRLPFDTNEDAHGDRIYGTVEMPEWAGSLRSLAWDTFSDATRSLDNSSRTLRAVATAERRLANDLYKTLDQYLEQQSQTVATGGER